MKSNIKVTIIQSILHWENVEANLQLFDEKLKEIGEKTDLVVLPEMFTTGFTMNTKPVAEPMNGRTMQWMAQHAKRLDAVITGSIIIKEGDFYFNRLIWMQPDGVYSTYDKRHLFAMAKEHKAFRQGQEKLIVEWRGWRFCPLICYDLRFPVWARNVENYDVLIYTANWSKNRSLHWKTLLQARAMENQCYVLGINRCGTDAKGFEYTGDSSIINPHGDIDYQVTNDEAVYTQELSADYLQEIQERLPFLIDKDVFEIDKSFTQ